MQIMACAELNSSEKICRTRICNNSIRHSEEKRMFDISQNLSNQ